MKNLKKSRLIGMSVAVLVVLAICISTIAAMTPAQTATRLDAEFKKTDEALEAFLGDESAAANDPEVQAWLAILDQYYYDASTALGTFPSSIKSVNCKQVQDATSDVFYMDSTFNAKIYGIFRTVRDKIQYKNKGAFHIPTGRFAVEFYVNSKMNDKDYFKYWNKEQNRYYNINKDDTLVGVVDYAPGDNFIYLQFAESEGRSSASCPETFMVYRVMMANGHIYMSKASKSIDWLQSHRVKSAFTSFDSFAVSYNDVFEYNGSRIRLVTNGVETIYSLAAESAEVAVGDDDEVLE